MRCAALIATVTGAFMVALVATAPATLLDAGLQRRSAGRLQLVEARGSVWSGSGRIEAPATGRAGVVGDLSWRVRPRSILHGRVDCEIVFGQAVTPLVLSIRPSGIVIEDADISVPAAVLALGVPQLGPLQPMGRVQIRVESLSIARRRVEGGARLHWLDAGSGLTGVYPLGEYEVELEGRGAEIGATLRTLAGPLRLDGAGTWDQGQAPLLRVTARVAAPYRAQLEPLLQLVAVDRGDGLFELQLGASAF